MRQSLQRRVVRQAARAAWNLVVLAALAGLVLAIQDRAVHPVMDRLPAASWSVEDVRYVLGSGANVRSVTLTLVGRASVEVNVGDGWSPCAVDAGRAAHCRLTQPADLGSLTRLRVR